MAMVEDLSVFFNVDEHASVGVLDNVEVHGIFENASQDAFDGALAAARPTFTLPSSVCMRARQGSTLRVIDAGGAHTPYTVSEIEPDGSGITTLRLTRVTHP